MGNKIQTNSSDQSAVEIVQRKAEMQFEQQDFIRQIQGSIESQYEVLSPCLQQNQFYQLRKVIHIKTRLVRAVYIVNKYKIRSHQRELFQQQIRELKKIDHPAVSKIYELFKSDHRFFVVMEYKQGVSLADALEEYKYFQEGAAAGVMWQLLGLLGHCHKRGITHTDLKLTSICFNSKKQDVIKVMDFSISKIFRVVEVIDQSIGRAVLSAPETVSGQTSSKSDVWSCGIILYILLCGDPPIIANTRNKLIFKFKSFFLRFRQSRFKHVSQQGKDMIRRMLRINPNERPSAQQMMESGWFIRFMRFPRLPAHSLQRCLKELYFYSPNSKLLEATWAFFVNSLISHDEKNLIMIIFLRLDKTSKGELDHQDLKQGYLELFGDEEKAEICASKILNRLRKNRIVFSEFVTFCANRFFLIREVNLQKIFELFDEDGSGEIEISELRDTLGNSKQVSQEVWVQLVREANASSGAKLNLEQFSDMIRQLNYAGRENELGPQHTFDW